MNGTNVLAALAAWARTPLAQALWETAKYGAPKVVEAVKQQTTLTPTDIAESTAGFASAADATADVPPEAPTPEPLVAQAPALIPHMEETSDARPPEALQ